MIEKIKHIVASCKLQVSSCKFQVASSSLLTIGSLLLLGSASCSDETLQDPSSDSDVTQIDGVYLSINLLPNSIGGVGSRADGDGSETGLVSENEIKSARIILAEKKIDNTSDYSDAEGGQKVRYEVVAYADVVDRSRISQDNPATSGEKSTVTVTGMFEYEPLQTYLGNDTKNLYVFVVANFSSNVGVRAPMVGKDVQASASVDNNDMIFLNNTYPGHTYTSCNGLEMTNEKPVEITLSLDNIKNANTVGAPWKLQQNGKVVTVNLQRSAARIDLDWNRLKFGFNGNEFVLIPTSKNQAETAESLEYESSDDYEYTLTIDAVALANVSRDYYLFQETSSGTDNWVFLGEETKESTVYNIRDPRIGDKINYDDILFQSLSQIKPGLANNNFSYRNPVDNTPRYYFLNVNDFASPAKRKARFLDNGLLTQPSGITINNEDYAVFHYTYPNSIYPSNEQLKKRCTAVIYRAKIEGTAMENTDHKDIFAYGSKIYGSYDTFKSSNDDTRQTQFSNIWNTYKAQLPLTSDELQYAINDLTQQIADLGEENDDNIAKIEEFRNQIAERTTWKKDVDAEIARVTADGFEEYSLPKSDYVYEEVFIKAAKTNKFSIFNYDKVADGYYCYYIYWIRHNDNKNVISMANMEFSIVRNYVYKLSVAGIDALGYPDDPDTDPDPIDPDDEIESADTYINIKALILPWGLRSDESLILK